MSVQSATFPILVIGYGNTLRRDDGAGQVVAETVKAWDLPHVRSISVHQLTPELAEPIANAELAIFVDAYPTTGEQEVQICSMKPASSTEVMGHTSDPRVLLAIAQALYNNHPPAWLVAIPGTNFEFGNHFSSMTEQGMEEALSILDRLIREHRPNTR